MSISPWEFPGSRWWKLDIHTHTPASLDSYWVKEQKEISAEEWLLRFMREGIDCVSITDHNSGKWIDMLKNAYHTMQERAARGALEGFREIYLFPGVELSVQGGIHVLAIFDTTASTSDIDRLLGKVDFRGAPGDNNAVTGKSLTEVLNAIAEAGAIPIPSHADTPKGLLQVQEDSRKSVHDALTIEQTLKEGNIFALEWIDLTKPAPEIATHYMKNLTRLVGSDNHGRSTDATPGSRYTWVKMETPNLEGLRLALIDGQGVSVKRCDEGDFRPYKLPHDIITRIEIENARYMGREEKAALDFNPYCNVLIGGRGTGKSSIINFLRLAMRRDGELEQLSSLYDNFKAFTEVPQKREDSGALQPNTRITVEWRHDDEYQRVVYQQKEKSFEVHVEELNEKDWMLSPSQSLDPERFPLRIFSQGQIAAMAENPQVLLAHIDEAAGIRKYKDNLEDAKRTYYSQQARLREIEGKLASLPELKRQLKEIEKKLEKLSTTHSADIYKSYQQSQRKKRAVHHTFEQLSEFVQSIHDLADNLYLDDWPDGLFDQMADNEILQWRTHIDAIASDLRKALLQVCDDVSSKVDASKVFQEYHRWEARISAIEKQYEEVKAQLDSAGIQDPREIDRWLDDQRQLEMSIGALKRLGEDARELKNDIQNQYQRIVKIRRDLTEARRAFLQNALSDNKYVRITVVPFGSNDENIERSFRDLIEDKDQFKDDINGIVDKLSSADEHNKFKVIESIKESLLRKENLGGRFRNYLERKMERPEFADRIQTWFPEDDVSVEYSRDSSGTNWIPITQGSKGQRAAALLAFLLAFGTEPIVMDQPEDDLDNHLIYDLIVAQIRENKLRRQLVIVTHNPNIVVNGDAEMIFTMGFVHGQCVVKERGALQQKTVREEVCHIMEGGREALERRWNRLKEIVDARNAK